jgi:cation diffusion facilitator family transporter
MKVTGEFDVPEHLQPQLQRAKRLAWLTIAYLVSVVVLMYLAMGNSQAMKTAWLDDLLSMIPPVVFLMSARIATWRPNRRFPYGYHRAVSIAFLCASVALCAMGTYLLAESIITLAKQERPSIGGVTLFGETFWLGWLMLPTLVWSGLPAVFLGRAKLPLGRALHDKVLFADAAMNKADWLSAGAAFVGVVGIGLGFWWADSVAAAVISIEIIRDGYGNLREVVTNLMDESPKTVDHSRFDPLPEELRQRLESYSWVREARVRLREAGHIYFGEGYVVVEEDENLQEKLREATEECRNLNWRVHDFVLVCVDRFAEADRTGPAELEDSKGAARRD